MDDSRLTYCGNVHAADDLRGWRESVESFSLPIAKAVRAEGHAFGLGAYWTAATAAELAGRPEALAELAAWLESHELPIWTLNVFPFGRFHAERVKTEVYRPDWAAPERLEFTVNAATAVSRLAPEGSVVPLSTLPLGYVEPAAKLDPARRQAMFDQLALAAKALDELSESSDRDLVLALEPEPFCLLETVAGTADLLEEIYGARPAGIPEAVLRRRLGVCVDLCHLAVVGEDPLAAIDGLRGRAVRVPKIQVSSCVEVRDPQAGQEALWGFAEPRYLHQTVAQAERSGQAELRALDLDEVRERWSEFGRANRLRTHFHVPVFWDTDGPLGSTRSELERVLPALTEPRPLFEVETYTWSVLAAAWRPEDDLTRGIERELAFTRKLIFG